MLAGQSHAFYWEAPQVFNDALEQALSDIYPDGLGQAPK
jgi:hypothetical protein